LKEKYSKIVESTNVGKDQVPPRRLLRKAHEVDNPSSISTREMANAKKNNRRSLREKAITTHVKRSFGLKIIKKSL